MITSSHNQRVKEAAKLRDARARRKQGRIIIDGGRELLRAIQADVDLVELFVCDELCQSENCRTVLRMLAAKQRTQAAHFELLTVSRDVFDKLAFGQRAEGVIGVAKTPSRSLADLKLPANPLVAILEGVEKPGNVGAVLRSAEGGGVSAVIVADGGTDLYNPNAIRASLGAIFTLPLCAATSAETFEWLRQRRLTIYAARVNATTDYTHADFTQPCAIVLGSEAAGLSEDWTQPADQGPQSVVPIRLPMRGHVDSLNVSAASAILFYEAMRQREAQPRPTRR